MWDSGQGVKIKVNEPFLSNSSVFTLFYNLLSDISFIVVQTNSTPP